MAGNGEALTSSFQALEVQFMAFKYGVAVLNPQISISYMKSGRTCGLLEALWVYSFRCSVRVLYRVHIKQSGTATRLIVCLEAVAVVWCLLGGIIDALSVETGPFVREYSRIITRMRIN